MLASTGMRFGELAGLRWSAVDFDRGVLHVREQYTHAAWSELKTENARRTIPLPAAVRELLKTRYAELNGNVVRLHPLGDQRTVFSNFGRRSGQLSQLAFRRVPGRSEISETVATVHSSADKNWNRAGRYDELSELLIQVIRWTSSR